MTDGRLVKLWLESVLSMESSGHKMSIVTLVCDTGDRQLTFVCDSYIRDQFFLRDSSEMKYDCARMLPEVLLQLLSYNRPTELKNLRMVIYAVEESEYKTEIEDLNNSHSFQIRLSDAVLLNKISKIPLYVVSDILDKQGTPYSKDDIYTKAMPINVLPVEQLEEALKKAVDDEDYRLAKVLSDELKKRKRKE